MLHYSLTNNINDLITSDARNQLRNRSSSCKSNFVISGSAFHRLAVTAKIAETFLGEACEEGMSCFQNIAYITGL